MNSSHHGYLIASQEDQAKTRNKKKLLKITILIEIIWYMTVVDCVSIECESMSFDGLSWINFWLKAFQHPRSIRADQFIFDNSITNNRRKITREYNDNLRGILNDVNSNQDCGKEFIEFRLFFISFQLQLLLTFKRLSSSHIVSHRSYIEFIRAKSSMKNKSNNNELVIIIFLTWLLRVLISTARQNDQIQVSRFSIP